MPAYRKEVLSPIARTHVAVLCAAVAGVLGCGGADAVAPREEAESAGGDALCDGPREVASAPTPATSLQVAWTRSFDTQHELLLFDRTIVESGWQGIAQHDLDDGREVARFAGSDRTFRAWIGVDAAHDPVLLHLGTFVLGRDRQARLARFELRRADPAWISPVCVRLHAAAVISDGVEIAAYCARVPTQPGAGPPPAELIVIDASNGRERARAPLPGTSFHEEHAVIEVGGTIAVRAGDHVLGIDRSARVLFDRAMPGSFGLAATERGIAVIESGVGLVELDPETGADLRRIADPSLAGAPDPFTSALGRLVVDRGTAYVEVLGTLHAIALRDGRTRWTVPGTDAEIDGAAIYACRGNRFVELDPATGATRSSYSTGGCEIVGTAGSTVLVRFEALPSTVLHEDDVWAGLLAFERRPGPPPECELARVHGVVRVNGIAAPRLAVRAGNAWAVESSGVTHLWGMPMTPTDEPPAAEARTDASGRYALTFCDRGHVPIVVDPEAARAFAGEDEAAGFSTYVHLTGARDYTIDFEVRAHGPTL